jgi:Skp family chaperone for outer membrane proteins
VSYVYIGEILNQLMQSEAIEEERDRLMADLQETETGYRQKLDDLNGRLQEMDPESEDAQRVFEEGRTVYDEYMRWQQGAMAQRGQLDAQHLERVYRDLVEAVQVVADRKGIDTVYRFIPTEEAFRAENPEQAMLAIRLRTAIRYPEELDITDDVLEELSLDVE